MRSVLSKLWKDEDGLTTVEYALLLVLIVIVAIAAWKLLGRKVNNAVQNANTNLGDISS